MTELSQQERQAARDHFKRLERYLASKDAMSDEQRRKESADLLSFRLAMEMRGYTLAKLARILDEEDELRKPIKRAGKRTDVKGTVKAFYKSGETQAEFCRQKKISTRTLRRYIRELEENPEELRSLLDT